MSNAAPLRDLVNLMLFQICNEMVRNGLSNSVPFSKPTYMSNAVPMLDLVNVMLFQIGSKFAYKSNAVP